MATVTIDGREYDVDKLSEPARQQVLNIAAIDQEIRRMQTLIAICQTARKTHVGALQGALPKD